MARTAVIIGCGSIATAHAYGFAASLHEVTRLPLATRVNPLDLLVESGAPPVLRHGTYGIRANLVRGDA